MTALLLELWQNHWFTKQLLFHARKSHKSPYKSFPELEMLTLHFCILLFYDQWRLLQQCLVALSAVRVQRLRIINGANFTGKALSLNFLSRNLEKKRAKFPEHEPFFTFLCQIWKVFWCLKALLFPQWQNVPLISRHLNVGPSPLTISCPPQAQTTWSRS